MGFRRKLNCCCDSWFVFDGLLVMCMVAETWLLPLIAMLSSEDGEGGDSGPLSTFSGFRLLRLLRLSRMSRLLRAVPELMILLKGVLHAARATFFVLLFLLLCTYVFAIVFTSVLGNPGAESDGEVMFASIGDAMMTLWSNGVLGDNLAETLFAIK